MVLTIYYGIIITCEAREKIMSKFPKSAEFIHLFQPWDYFKFFEPQPMEYILGIKFDATEFRKNEMIKKGIDVSKVIAFLNDKERIEIDELVNFYNRVKTEEKQKIGSKIDQLDVGCSFCISFSHSDVAKEFKEESVNEIIQLFHNSIIFLEIMKENIIECTKPVWYVQLIPTN